MQHIEQYLADYLVNNLSPQQKVEIEAVLAQNPKKKEEWNEMLLLWNTLSPPASAEPTERLDTDFYALLAHEQRLQTKPTRSLWQSPWLRYAALVVALLGVFLLGQQMADKQVVTNEKRVTVYVPKIVAQRVEVPVYMAKASQKNTQENQEVLTQIATIKQEVEGLQSGQEKLMLAMLERESASDRLQAIAFSAEINNPDTVVLAALISTLDTDPNFNVRLASAEALTRFGNNRSVRLALVNSLLKQQDPVLQIELIELLTRLRERQAIPALTLLAQANYSSENVKNKAEEGLRLLNL